MNRTASQLELPGVDSDPSASEWTWGEDGGEVTESARFVHATVMRDEVATVIGPRRGGLYVDATVGGGGHAEALLEAAPEARLVGLDRDPLALEAAEARLARFEGRFELVHSDFSRVGEVLEGMGVKRIDGLCADLGVSSPQLDEAGRGMSFRREGPLDMRMDTTSGETALELIERTSDDELANVIYRYGDERRSRRIARSIHRAQEAGELVTTLDLRRAIVRAVGPVRVGGIDPATRTFQALRIAVNRELEELETLLRLLPDLVAPGGVVAVISFHSLEDRLVKQAFLDQPWAPIWKRPISASDEESAQNPRARSAKLRAARRRDDDGGGGS